MAESTLLLAGGISALSAGVFWFVGESVAQRRVGVESRPAAVGFSLWWYGLAGSTFITAVNTWLFAFDKATLIGFKIFSQLSIVVVLIGLGGLLYYLLFLFTGYREWWKWLLAFYIPYYLLLQYYIELRNPIGVKSNGWSATLDYEHPADVGGPLFTLVLYLLILPQILGALSYFTLAFKVHDRERRYRIVVVSWSIIVWFASAIGASEAGRSETLAWQITSRLLSLGAALMILTAYRPPRFLQRWFEGGPRPEATDIVNPSAPDNS